MKSPSVRSIIATLVLALVVNGCSTGAINKERTDRPSLALALLACIRGEFLECYPRTFIYNSGQVLEGRRQGSSYPSFSAFYISEGAVLDLKEQMRQATAERFRMTNRQDATVFAAEGTDADSYVLYQPPEPQFFKVVGSIEPPPVGNPRERMKLPSELRTAFDAIFNLHSSTKVSASPSRVDVLLVPCPQCSPGQARSLPSWMSEFVPATCSERYLPAGSKIASVDGREYSRAVSWSASLGPDPIVTLDQTPFIVRLMPHLPGGEGLRRPDWCSAADRQLHDVSGEPPRSH